MTPENLILHGQYSFMNFKQVFYILIIKESGYLQREGNIIDREVSREALQFSDSFKLFARHEIVGDLDEL